MLPPILISWLELQIECARALSSRKKEAKQRGWDAIRLSDGSKEILFVCTRDNYAINHFLITISLSLCLVSDLQFPIDLSCVEKDHPFLQKDQLQSLYRRLLVLNRSAAMRLDGQYNRNINVCRLIYIYFPLFTVFHSASFTPISLDLTQNFIHPKPRKLRYSHGLISIFLTLLCQRRDTRFPTALYAHESRSQSSTRDHPWEEKRFFHSTQFNSRIIRCALRYRLCVLDWTMYRRKVIRRLSDQTMLTKNGDGGERLWTIETKENRSHDWWLQFMLSSMSLQASISIIYYMLSLFDVGIR